MDPAVPNSKTRVGDRAIPVCFSSVAARRVADRESRPTSIKGADAVTSALPVSALTQSSTAAVSWSSVLVSAPTAKEEGRVGTPCSMNWSTALRSGSMQSGFLRAPKSPSASPASTVRSSPRMYLPLIVSGSMGITTKCEGTAAGLTCACTVARMRPSSAASSATPCFSTMKAHGTVPKTASSMPTTAQLSNGECSSVRSSRIALSISSVPMRLPPTFITSSDRP